MTTFDTHTLGTLRVRSRKSPGLLQVRSRYSHRPLQSLSDSPLTERGMARTTYLGPNTYRRARARSPQSAIFFSLDVSNHLCPARSANFVPKEGTPEATKRPRRLVVENIHRLEGKQGHTFRHAVGLSFTLRGSVTTACPTEGQKAPADHNTCGLQRLASQRLLVVHTTRAEKLRTYVTRR